MREVEARLKISAVDRTGRVLKTVGDKLGQVNQRAEQYNRSMSMMGRIGQQMAFLGPTVALTAVTAGLTQSVRASAKFEESLFGIQKKSGATAEQMANLGEEIKGLATEMPVSVDEIASAFERGAAAGIPLDELKEFAKLTAGVADAWDTTSENVGNVFAGFNVGLGIARKDLTAFASLINDLADSGIADETGIADFIDRAGASLKNFGMSPEEIAAYGAALLNLKMPAEVGARAMDTITGKLLAPENLSDKSFAALEGIVGDVGKFAKLAGNQKLQHFLTRLDKMSSQRRASLLGALLGEGFDDEIMRLVSGSSELTRNLDLARRHVANPSNSIIEAQAKKLELFNSQLAIMGNNVRVIATEVGDTFLPAMTDIAKSINETLASGRDHNKGVAGMSREEQSQQFKWFFDRFVEENPDDWTAGSRAMVEYDKAVEGVGRGEYKDVYDYIRQLKSVNRYARGENKASVGRQGQPIAAYPGEEFPGGGGGYDPKNLPVSGPVPRDRNAPSKAEIQALKDQYALYGAGREKTVKAGPMMDLKGQDAFDGFLDFHGLKNGAEDAGRSVAEGGKEAGGAMKDAAGEASNAASALSQAADKLLSVVTSINRLGNFTNPGGSTGVNADTGRSMPPSTARPASPGGRM